MPRTCDRLFSSMIRERIRGSFYFEYATVVFQDMAEHRSSDRIRACARRRARAHAVAHADMQ
ncbi:hypothetical protein WS72_25550 [Burkholderia savannae]|uniref:Uncharacterized protein n=1 Tax=Burkholderia savannae TaxID=1637837 RepID=A0ABR5T4Y3_9BURK|nr:hypothetical protein WS91_04885 [Burkholderia sp. MSMB1498]KWZ38238.1 hypothetical protein WS72_25550 [Burkholderia savannae]